MCIYIYTGCFFNVIVFQVLGVSPIEGFDAIKAKYTRKRKDAENRGDEATAARVGYNSLSSSLKYLFK